MGHPAPGPNDKCGSTWDRVSRHFLDTIAVPVVCGRGFTEQDRSSSQPVAIVNQAFAKRYFLNQDPIGKLSGIDYPQYSGAFEIVGVFADFKMNNPRERARSVFLPPLARQFTGFKEPGLIAGEESFMFVSSIILHFTQPQQGLEDLTRRTLAGIDPNLTVFSLHSLDSQASGNFNQDHLIARLTSLFGMLAVILASGGPLWRDGVLRGRP